MSPAIVKDCQLGKTAWFVCLTARSRRAVLEKESRSKHPRLTEAMLAAKPEMSNNFLHSGQSIDFIQQKGGSKPAKLWKLGAIASFVRMTKRKRLCGLDSLRLAGSVAPSLFPQFVSALVPIRSWV